MILCAQENRKLLLYTTVATQVVYLYPQVHAPADQPETSKNTITHSSPYTETKTELVKNQVSKSQYRVPKKMKIKNKKSCAHISSTIHYNRSENNLTGHWLSMSRVPGLARGSTCIELLIHRSDPHGKNHTQQSSQAGHA